MTSVDPEISPTLTMGASVSGVIMGTAVYMSPEQAGGSRVDHRTDIWAFGVVLYEIATGKRMFGGETVTAILAAVPRADNSIDQARRNCKHCCIAAWNASQSSGSVGSAKRGSFLRRLRKRRGNEVFGRSSQPPPQPVISDVSRPHRRRCRASVFRSRQKTSPKRWRLATKLFRRTASSLRMLGAPYCGCVTWKAAFPANSPGPPVR